MAKVIFLLLSLITVVNNTLAGNNINSQYYSEEDSLKIIEKVYLHVDRDIYSPGDDIWFKGYLVDASTRSLTDHSHNLHVELISPDSKIIESRIIRLNEGLGNGDFHIPKIIKSGRYSLRAYTNYMQNFGDQLFFVKDIKIIDLSAAIKDFPDSLNGLKKKLEINFFPEGGSLVDNVQSIVGFKAVDAFGAGCDVYGNLYSSAGELVTTFKSDYKGMGSFAITPVFGVDYYAVVKNLNRDEVKSEFPRCFPTGLVLNLSENQTNELEVIIRTNTGTLASLPDQDLSLTVSAHKVVYKTVKFRIKSCNNSLILSTDDLPDGIVILTISGPDNKPLCERLVYIQNNEDIKINLKTNKSIYKQRDSVSVKISLSDNYAIAPEAYASFSATEDVSTNGTSRFSSTICSWFLLESDIHGPIEEPSYYFDSSNPDRLKDLDLLLLTQGWRDFEWKYKTMIYPPEQGFTISGRVRKKNADLPLINSNVTVCLFNNGKPVIYTISTDSSGKFFLKGIDVTGEENLIVSSTGENNKLQGWVLLDSIKYVPASIFNSRISLNNIDRKNKIPESTDVLRNDNVKTFIQYCEIKNSLRKKYKLTDTINIGEVSIIAHRQDPPGSVSARSRLNIYGAPDKQMLITPELEKYGTVMKLLGTNRNMLKGITIPIFVIDGVTVPYDLFSNYPVSNIARIDILNTTASVSIFGPNTENPGSQIKPADGVISITTRKDDPSNSTTRVFHTAKVNFAGYNEPRIFYSPKHHVTLESDYKPDLRTTLFWEPNLKLENNEDLNLNYYNADNPSTIKIIVEGITTTGIPVTGSVTYKVQ